MRNPLNSILNQCEIMSALLLQFAKIVKSKFSLNVPRDKAKLIDINTEIENCNKV